MDNFVIAMSRYKRRRYDDCITLCDQMLASNAQDQAAWLLKCNSLIQKQFIDDLELDEEGIGDILMDENQTSQLARPGTSFQRPMSSANNLANPNPVVRPMVELKRILILLIFLTKSKSGRPLTGFARPSTNRPITSSQGSISQALQGSRPGTNRPITQGGRFKNSFKINNNEQDIQDWPRLHQMQVGMANLQIQINQIQKELHKKDIYLNLYVII